MTWWFIGAGIWVAVGWPLSISLGYQYGRQWDNKIYGYLLIFCFLASLPYLLLNWSYLRIRYGKAKP